MCSVCSELCADIKSIKFSTIFGYVIILLAITFFMILYAQKNNYDVHIQNTQNFMEIEKRNVLENIEADFF